MEPQTPQPVNATYALASRDLEERAMNSTVMLERMANDMKWRLLARNAKDQFRPTKDVTQAVNRIATTQQHLTTMLRLLPKYADTWDYEQVRQASVELALASMLLIYAVDSDELRHFATSALLRE